MRGRVKGMEKGRVLGREGKRKREGGKRAKR